MDNKAGNNHVRASQKQGIRPGFLGGTDKATGPAALTDETKIGAKKAGARESAAEGLRKSEESASGGLYRSEDSLAGARGLEREPRTGGFYSGGGKSKGKGNTKGKGTFKKGGPFIGIILAIFGFGGVMMGSQMFQPFSLVAQFQEKFNSMHMSANVRSSRFVKWQMGGVDKGVKDPIKVTIFGNGKFNISKKQKSKLAAQGIDYDESTKKMRFDTGEVEVDANGNTRKKYIDVDADNFDSVYANNADFHQAYNAGSRTWRGQFANWFGSKVVNFILDSGLTRNMFNDFRNKVETSGKSSWEVFKDTLNDRINKTNGDVGAKQSEIEEQEDENGNKKVERKADSETEESVSTKADVNTVKTKMQNVAKKAAQTATIGCAVMQGVGAISIMVSVAEMLQIMNLTTAAFETVDKVKAGYGDEAPIHELTNALNSNTRNVTYSANAGGIEYGKNSNGELVATGGTAFVEGETNKTAMESAGIAALYGDGKVNIDDPSAASFNLQKSINGIIGGLTTAGLSFAGCAVAKISAAAISAGTTIAACAASFGIGCLIGSMKKLAWDAAKTALITTTVSILIPTLAKIFTRNLVENLGGEDLGNALASGGNSYLGRVHRTTGGSLSNASNYTAYLTERESVIADNAKYERETLSPFDITSKYTFMGTLMTQLMSFNTSSGTLMSIIKAGNSALSNSIVAMSPTASAYNISEILPGEDYGDTCPNLASIGAVGDAFCNPYIMTDMTTMDDTPGAIIQDVKDLGGLELNSSGELKLTNDDNVVIDKNSNLARYITYCGERSSQFGVADNSIADNVSSVGTLNSDSQVANTAVNSVVGSTIIGDLFDIWNGKKQLLNMGWITGESCVAGNNAGGMFSESPNWNETKKYQRFAEDQALAESMGLVEESAVTAFLREYYEENPLDNSYEGILARYSGLDKDTVAYTLDLMWVADYIANYDPEERYAFVDFEVEEPAMNFDNEYILASGMKATEEMVYADVRNRSFAI